MVFADQLDAAGQALSWTGIVGAVLTMLGTVVTAVIASRKAERELMHDRKVAVLEQKVTDLEASNGREMAGHAECRAEVSRLRSKQDQMIDWLARRGMPKPGTGEHDSLPGTG